MAADGTESACGLRPYCRFSCGASGKPRLWADMTSGAVADALQDAHVPDRTSACSSTVFPNEPSLLRLVSAVLLEFSEEWETGRIYLPRESC